MRCGAAASILEPIDRMARTAKRSPARRAKSAVSWATVREMGMALPDVEEGTTYGTPALKVRGQMFTCVPSNRAAEPDSLVLRLSFDARDELIEAEPATYYVKEHYVPYATRARPVVEDPSRRASRSAARKLRLRPLEGAKEEMKAGPATTPFAARQPDSAARHAAPAASRRRARPAAAPRASPRRRRGRAG